MAKTILGIDPGASGGIAIINDDYVNAWPMPPTQRDLFELIESYGSSIAGPPNVAFIEKVGASPQMGVVSAFKFGQSFGGITMACLAAGIRVEFVTPQKWQKALGLKPTGHGIGKGDTAKKNRNKARAQELFNGTGLKLTHAVCDALLLAEYGRRQLNGTAT